MVADAKPTVSVIIRRGMRYLFDMALKYEKYTLLLIRDQVGAAVILYKHNVVKDL
jgi:hypothetical protein